MDEDQILEALHDAMVENAALVFGSATITRAPTSRGLIVEDPHEGTFLVTVTQIGD